MIFHVLYPISQFISCPYHPKNYEIEIREDSKGFSLGRRSLREQTTLNEVVDYL